jgi:AraC family transcriptional regulator
MHWGIGQGQPDSKPEMGLLVTRSYRKRRNDQPEDNSRDTAKDPLARMGSLAGLVVHGRRSSVEPDPRWRPEEFLFISGRSSSRSERTPETELSAEATRMLQDICRLASENPEGARDAALWLVALLVLRGFSQSARVRGGLAPWQKRKIEQYLREHLRHPIRVDELAQQLPLSVSYFCRAFKQTFGTSQHEYIIQQRLEQARELILTTTDPLGQIAFDCGFGDQAHFQFRR